MCCCPEGQDCSGFFIGGGSPCRSTPKHSHRGKSQSSHLLLQWEGPRPELSQPSIPLLPTSPALLCSCKSGFAHRARVVLVVLTRQTAPGGGWYLYPGLVGLLDVGLTVHDDSTSRPPCLALMWGDLWSSAGEDWQWVGSQGILGEAQKVGLPSELGAGRSFSRSLEEGTSNSCPWVKGWEGKQSPWGVEKWVGAWLAEWSPLMPFSLRTGSLFLQSWCACPGVSHAVGGSSWHKKW